MGITEKDEEYMYLSDSRPSVGRSGHFDLVGHALYLRFRLSESLCVLCALV